MNAAGGQIQGKRADQEDAWRIQTYAPDEVLASVADGLGGHPAGDVASRTAIDEFLAQFGRRRAEARAAPRQWLQESVMAADAHLHDCQRRDRALMGMATTMVSLYVQGKAFWAASVGDSYLLLQRKGQLLRLNELHAEDGGVTSCLGFNLTRVDIADRLATEPGDRFMLASDGITTLDDDELRVLLTNAPDAETAVREVLEAIDNAGQPYQDNATAVAIFI
jgi:PPM family protein phosphatase